MVDMMAPERASFYIDFELHPIEDRDASIKAGHPVFKDQEMAILTMPGGQLVVPKPVTPQLLHEWQFGDGQRKPPAPHAFNAYQAWKNNQEIPLEGTDIRNWPGVTPAQVKTCHGANIRTLEDLASANDEAVRLLGMGGRALVQKAKAYLESADQNKSSEQIAALTVRVEELAESLTSKDEQIAELEQQLKDAQTPAPNPTPNKAKKG